VLSTAWLSENTLSTGFGEWTFRVASHGDDDLSLSVSFFQIPDGLWDFGERVRPVDHRCDLSGLEELLQDNHLVLLVRH
jgi:hypothetical protein